MTFSNLIKGMVMINMLLIAACSSPQATLKEEKVSYSGIYPHLAYYNNEGECGTGAVVPWANRLWVITYGPHLPGGSSDKLYEITPELEQIVRPESIGGTPANRMIHEESKQLFIGPYAIDANRNVRAIPYDSMYGRHTGNARHLTEPAKKIYYATMEEGFYEVDVNTLDVNTLYKDANLIRKEGEMDQYGPLLPGAHGKGLYSGQGVLVYSNNGEANKQALTDFATESGSLCEWDGDDWKVVRRDQFVEVTGPGGIYGNEDPENDPIWTTGWDHKSLIVGVRYKDEWTFYRLPKASHSYDGAHGWNTEWPRIRDIGTKEKPDYLMTMHGMFWHFPKYFNPGNSTGIRPRSAYLKVIGDFARWNGRLVFGCDDAAHKEFLNKRKAKGGIEGPGQSNSNLWFTTPEKPDQLGTKTATGAVWLNEKIAKGEYSEPFLFAGWPYRSVWINNEGGGDATFILETDKNGDGNWIATKKIEVPASASAHHVFTDDESGEWIRIKPDKQVTATVVFSYSGNEKRGEKEADIFSGIAEVDNDLVTGGLLYGLGDNMRALGIVAMDFDGVDAEESGYYELDGEMNLVKKEDTETASFIKETFAIPENVITIDETSILVVDDDGRRWRLPKGNKAYKDLTASASLRICREIATERDLFSCYGTFYELPAENADGYAKIRPVATHNFRVHDYATYRGLLIMTGIQKEQVDNHHIIRSEDGKAAVWAGAVDDLWELGKPTGIGGPWKGTQVKASVPSDPYLIGFYDKKRLTISHQSKKPVTFRIEVEPLGHGPWMLYKEVLVEPDQEYKHTFPEGFQARWIRFKAGSECKATAQLVYE